MGWTLHMIMCVFLCYPVSIRIYYQQGVLFLVDPTTQVKTCFDCKMVDVANWVACLNGENGPGGTPSNEALPVSSQGALEIFSVTGQPPSLDRNLFCTPRLVAESYKRDKRCRPSSQRSLPKNGGLQGQTMVHWLW